LRVAVNFFGGRWRSARVAGAGADDAVTNFGGSIRARWWSASLVIYGGDVDVDIDAIHERAGDFRDVAAGSWAWAGALAGAVIAGSRRGRDSSRRRA